MKRKAFSKLLLVDLNYCRAIACVAVKKGKSYELKNVAESYNADPDMAVREAVEQVKAYGSLPKNVLMLNCNALTTFFDNEKVSSVDEIEWEMQTYIEEFSTFPDIQSILLSSGFLPTEKRSKIAEIIQNSGAAWKVEVLKDQLLSKIQLNALEKASGFFFDLASGGITQSESCEEGFLATYLKSSELEHWRDFFKKLKLNLWAVSGRNSNFINQIESTSDRVAVIESLPGKWLVSYLIDGHLSDIKTYQSYLNQPPMALLHELAAEQITKVALGENLPAFDSLKNLLDEQSGYVELSEYNISLNKSLLPLVGIVDSLLSSAKILIPLHSAKVKRPPLYKQPAAYVLEACVLWMIYLMVSYKSTAGEVKDLERRARDLEVKNKKIASRIKSSRDESKQQKLYEVKIRNLNKEIKSLANKEVKHIGSIYIHGLLDSLKAMPEEGIYLNSLESSWDGSFKIAGTSMEEKQIHDFAEGISREMKTYLYWPVEVNIQNNQGSFRFEMSSKAGLKQ